MSDNSNGGAYMVLAFLAGAVTGAAVALLTTPHAGDEARQSLRNWARGAQGKAGRVPEAVKAAYGQASVAAKEAFLETWQREAEVTDEPSPTSDLHGV